MAKDERKKEPLKMMVMGKGGLMRGHPPNTVSPQARKVLEDAAGYKPRMTKTMRTKPNAAPRQPEVRQLPGMKVGPGQPKQIRQPREGLYRMYRDSVGEAAKETGLSVEEGMRDRNLKEAIRRKVRRET